MSYLGRYRQGDYVTLATQSRDASNAPQVPADCPLANLWSPAGVKVASFPIPPVDTAAVTGLFLMPFRLGVAYSALGMWRIVYEYLTGNNYNALDEDTFELIEGGSPEGNVIAMYYFRRPQADFLVQELDSGKLISGRNPKL